MKKMSYAILGCLFVIGLVRGGQTLFQKHNAPDLNKSFIIQANKGVPVFDITMYDKKTTNQNSKIELAEWKKQYNKRIIEIINNDPDGVFMKEFVSYHGDKQKIQELFKQYDIVIPGFDVSASHKKHIVQQILSSEEAFAASCTGGPFCGQNFVGKDIQSAFSLPAQRRSRLFSQLLYDELTNLGIRPDRNSIYIFGGGACPYAVGTAAKATAKNKFLLIGEKSFHACGGGQASIPFFDGLQPGGMISSQMYCMDADEINANSVALASQLGTTPLFISIAEDGSGIRPGAWKIQYGLDGYGTPVGNTDAKIEMFHATFAEAK